MKPSLFTPVTYEPRYRYAIWSATGQAVTREKEG